jgi:hypothetical protein
MKHVRRPRSFIVTLDELLDTIDAWLESVGRQPPPRKKKRRLKRRRKQQDPIPWQ